LDGEEQRTVDHLNLTTKVLGSFAASLTGYQWTQLKKKVLEHLNRQENGRESVQLTSALSVKVSGEDGAFWSERMGTGNCCDVLAWNDREIVVMYWPEMTRKLLWCTGLKWQGNCCDVLAWNDREIVVMHWPEMTGKLLWCTGLKWQGNCCDVLAWNDREHSFPLIGTLFRLTWFRKANHSPYYSSKFLYP